MSDDALVLGLSKFVQFTKCGSDFSFLESFPFGHCILLDYLSERIPAR
jgi:hypothetical protein